MRMGQGRCLRFNFPGGMMQCDPQMTQMDADGRR